MSARLKLKKLKTQLEFVRDAIVRKYTEQLAEYIHDQLRTKYMFNNFATFGIRLLAPALTEDHIKIDLKEE